MVVGIVVAEDFGRAVLHRAGGENQIGGQSAACDAGEAMPVSPQFFGGLFRVVERVDQLFEAAVSFWDGGEGGVTLGTAIMVHIAYYDDLGARIFGAFFRDDRANARRTLGGKLVSMSKMRVHDDQFGHARIVIREHQQREECIFGWDLLKLIGKNQAVGAFEQIEAVFAEEDGVEAGKRAFELGGEAAGAGGGGALGSATGIVGVAVELFDQVRALGRADFLTADDVWAVFEERFDEEFAAFLPGVGAVIRLIHADIGGYDADRGVGQDGGIGVRSGGGGCERGGGGSGGWTETAGQPCSQGQQTSAKNDSDKGGNTARHGRTPEGELEAVS